MRLAPVGVVSRLAAGLAAAATGIAVACIAHVLKAGNSDGLHKPSLVMMAGFVALVLMLIPVAIAGRATRNAHATAVCATS